MAKKGWLIGGTRGMAIHFGAKPLCFVRDMVEPRGVYATTVTSTEDVTCYECIELLAAETPRNSIGIDNPPGERMSKPKFNPDSYAFVSSGNPIKDANTAAQILLQVMSVDSHA